MSLITEVGSGGVGATGKAVIYYKDTVVTTRNGYGRAMKNSNILKTIEENKNKKATINPPIASVVPTYPSDSFRIQHVATYCDVGQKCADGVLPKIVAIRQGQYMPPKN